MLVTLLHDCNMMLIVLLQCQFASEWLCGKTLLWHCLLHCKKKFMGLLPFCRPPPLYSRFFHATIWPLKNFSRFLLVGGDFC